MEAWARALSDPAAFLHEQECLAHVWTVLCLTTDIPDHNDWIRSQLGNRSVFVQRFGTTIRAFENRCAHRQFPLRTEEKGNGEIRCPFHHWQYNELGKAVGIPRCLALFGKKPDELDAKLLPVEVQTCGGLVFGRFADAGSTQSLEDYLGEGFPILQAIASIDRKPRRFTRTLEANWQLSYHISMDDYHLVAVHPSTFGKNGYLTTGVTYFRFGEHSAYFPGGGEADFARMARECRDGSYVPHRFRIFHFFPNFSAVILKVPGFFLVTLIQYRPLAVDRTELRIWYYPAPFQTKTQSMFQRACASYVTFWMPHFILKVLGEDNIVNEQHQKVAHRIDGAIFLGAHEERISWFIESYRRATSSLRRASSDKINTRTP